MSDDDAAQRETAMNALAVLTGTFADGHRVGPVTMDLIHDVATDGRERLRLVIGMTAVSRLLIGMRERETGTSYDATLADLGRQVQELFPGA
jgi:hypothetical protein